MRKTPLLLALALAGALAPDAQAASGDLAVRSVAAARTVATGGTVAVDVRVARSGRTRAAKLRFYLSADGRHDRADSRLAGDVRVGAGGRARARRVSALPRVAVDQALGTYRLIACVDDPSRVRERNERNNCRAGKRKLEVTATPMGTRELVEAAVAARRLTPQQGIVYRVFAAVGDPRLPATFTGDESEVEHAVMREVVERWPTLSASQRATLTPFFTPPAAKRAKPPRTAARAGAAAAGPTCPTREIPAKEWLTIAKPGGHVRIWWLKSEDGRVGPRARSLVTEIENHMWPRLVALLRREPLRDGGERCFHGIDDKLDIYLWGLDRNRALTVPYPPRCAGTPAFIVFDARSTLPRRWEVAHELMHAFQFAYRYKGSCASWMDWDEAAATWAAEYLYPRDDQEHSFYRFLAHPEQSLADQSYDGWVFPYAMARLHGPGTVGGIYEQSERQGTVLQAIDAAVPGSLEKAWPEFARLAWNQAPVEPTFRQWDRFDQVPWSGTAPIGREQIDVAGTGQNELHVPVDLAPLSRAYRHLKFGADVKHVTVSTPYAPNLHVEALLRFRDGSTRTEELSRRRLAVFCPEPAGERLDEMLLVVTNTSLTEAQPADPPLKVVATNLGCSRYVGTASGVEHTRTQSTNTTETWTVSGLVYKRRPSGQDNTGILFELAGGSVTWSFSGTQYDCTLKAGPVTLPVKTGEKAGLLDIQTWAPQRPIRLYRASGWDLPLVEGTATCSSGTYTRSFRPHTFLETSDGYTNLDVPADGILQGSRTSDQGSGGARTVTYDWRLAPED